ncbi:hypothetical protein D929_02334 [Enterococcus faecalis 02-MB-P-10]|nr:hypothetical protein D929_02334 [Enterococcus faecalis 02-MB-P-10]
MAPSEDSSLPTPVIGTFRGYIEENKVMIGDHVYCQKEIKDVRMYHHSSKITYEKRENPFSEFSSPPLSSKDQEELEDYFNDWNFRDANF